MPSSADPVFLSVVIPCHNEASSIMACVESVARAVGWTHAEILVVDGMSKDGSRDIIANMMLNNENLRLIDNPSTITPVGLNLGIRASRGTLVAVLSAHSTVAPNYFKALVGTLDRFREAGCAGGILIPHPRTHGFQAVAGQVLSSRFGVGDSSFRTGVDEPVTADTAAYAVYRASVFDEVGLFDERLVRNQDIELSHRITRAGYVIVVDPNAVAYYVPRATLRSFCRQAFDNGMWNVVTQRLVPGSLSFRHFVPMAATLGGLLLLMLSSVMTGAGALLLVLSGAYAGIAVTAALQTSWKERTLRYLGCALLFPCLHVSYGLGSIVGLLRLLVR